ncbi:MAG TPA: polysaccharide pyruvyl transferase family protein [Opitutaceae bacterium]|nr:polysaccharide pyruvyl transferase family protein [Opitutaceae bacterium]
MRGVTAAQAQPVVLPRVLNLQAIDVCNSRCIMCNIWKDGKKEMLSLEALRTLLRQPFFANVTHVGVTGGEPTLRKDLFDLYVLLAECLPKLTGASFITHGMQSSRAVEVYCRIHEHYRARSLTFEGMVSLDGVGAVHDRVRGRSGAFESASKTLLELRARGVNVLAACTVVRSNVYGLHDLLGWGRAHGIRLRFRVAEFIKRLYNDPCAPEIRSFTDRELRHLVSFFHLLLTQYEKEDAILRTYRSILSLLTGGERLADCPYRKGAAVNLGSSGELASCAPKGESFVPRPEAAAVHQMLAAQRLEVAAKHCAKCIHDYHDGWSAAALGAIEQDRECSKELYEIPEDQLTTAEAPEAPFDPATMKEILLAGWYGTETAGDIAIIRGIIAEYLRANPALKFRVLSLHPFYTRCTVADWPEELRSRVQVTDYRSKDAWKAAEECGAIVMAGGPLMDIHETGMILCLFKRFADRGMPRVIEGCGVGPLHRDDFRWNVCRIARLATRITVRDSASRDALRLFGIRKAIEVRSDPATTFLRELGIKHHGSDGKVVRCFLRELTSEYPQSLTPEQATGNLLTLLHRLLEWYPAHRIELWAMHHFPVGMDDRQFAREVVRRIGNPRLSCVWEPRTPTEIAEAMAAAEFCVCMRFHSCVFASEVGVPFLAVDYTAGGKINGMLEDIGQEARRCTLGDLAAIDREGFNSRVWSNPSEKNVSSLAPVQGSVPQVLHVIQCLGGGGGARAMLSMARHSRASGGPSHQVASIQPAERTGIELARQAGVEVLDCPSPGALRKAMAGVEIVLVHWWNCPELATLFRSELPPVRLALWLHVGGFRAPQVILPELVEFADLTVACSPYTFSHPVLAALPGDAGRQRATMIMAGAEFSRLEGLAPRAHEGFRVGYIGTVDPVKMHPDFVSMSCCADVPGVKFVVCGGGNTRWLEEQAMKLRRRDSFELRGTVEDIRSVLEEMDVYGYPLCAETYAAAELNLQEAMYAGLPVVAFPHGGIGHMITHGDTGILVNNAEEYARAIEHLHRNPVERARLGANAAAFARQHWGAEKTAADFNIQFKKLLMEPKRARQWSAVSESAAPNNLVREMAIFPGARLFVESLGEAAGPFVTSLTSTKLDDLAKAEELIGAQPLLTHYICAFNYRKSFPADPFLELWAGLGFLQRGKPHDAFEAFEQAIKRGLTHWRMSWYLALAAEKTGKVAEAATACRAVLRVIPGFVPAREMQQRLAGSDASANAQRCVQEAQQFLKVGEFAKARVLLARASALVPGQIVLMELEADLDCRLGRVDSARRILNQIWELDPQRRSPRIDAITAALNAGKAGRLQAANT